MVVLPRPLDLTHVVVWESAKVLGNGGVVVGQVMRVEDDALAVDLGIAHAERPGEFKL